MVKTFLQAQETIVDIWLSTPSGLLLALPRCLQLSGFGKAPSIDPNFVVPYPEPARISQCPPSILISQSPPPVRVVMAGMPRALTDFSPIYSTEQVPISFDFSKSLVPGETLLSSQWSIALVVGTDAAPSSRLLGSSSILGSFITQWVGGYQQELHMINEYRTDINDKCTSILSSCGIAKSQKNQVKSDA